MHVVIKIQAKKIQAPEIGSKYGGEKIAAKVNIAGKPPKTTSGYRLPYFFQNFLGLLLK